MVKTRGGCRSSPRFHRMLVGTEATICHNTTHLRHGVTPLTCSALDICQMKQLPTLDDSLTRVNGSNHSIDQPVTVKKRGKFLKWSEENMSAIKHARPEPSFSVREAAILYNVPRYNTEKQALWKSCYWSKAMKKTYPTICNRRKTYRLCKQ